LPASVSRRFAILPCTCCLSSKGFTRIIGIIAPSILDFRFWILDYKRVQIEIPAKSELSLYTQECSRQNFTEI
jgi:hypothetical protein